MKALEHSDRKEQLSVSGLEKTMIELEKVIEKIDEAIEDLKNWLKKVQEKIEALKECFKTSTQAEVVETEGSE